MDQMMNNCCGGMAVGMWIGGLLGFTGLVLLIIWLFKQIRK
jgi:hypothetical protein